MNILSPNGPRPLSTSLSFIGHHTVSPPEVSFVGAEGFEPPMSKTDDLQSSEQPLLNTPKIGKQKMVQWTSVFIIGVTNRSSNSDDINFPPLRGISYHHSPINLLPFQWESNPHTLNTFLDWLP